MPQRPTAPATALATAQARPAPTGGRAQRAQACQRHTAHDARYSACRLDKVHTSVPAMHGVDSGALNVLDPPRACCRYCTDTQQSTASKLWSASAQPPGSAFRSRTKKLSRRLLRASCAPRRPQLEDGLTYHVLVRTTSSWTSSARRAAHRRQHGLAVTMRVCCCRAREAAGRGACSKRTRGCTGDTAARVDALACSRRLRWLNVCRVFWPEQCTQSGRRGS